MAQRRMLVTLEIPSKDRSYPWFLEWMALHAPQQAAIPSPPARGGSSSASSPSSTPSGPFASIRSLLKGKGPMTLRSHELAVETAFKQHENGSSEAVFNLVPGPGTHYFRYKGSWFQVSRRGDPVPLSSPSQDQVVS
jgi:chaperone BCS1